MSKFFRAMSSATFAEHGTRDQAIEILDRPEREHYTRLVVVGRGAVFSDKIIDYALEMAKRMDYEIVAVSAAPLLACHTLTILHHHRDKVCADFEEQAKESIEEFRTKAKELDVGFTHVIKYHRTQKVLHELKRELGGFEFIVSEEESESEIFVFSIT